MRKTLIGMLTFNSEIHIRKVMENIKSQLEEDWELHIFDDRSTDATVAILMEYSNDPRVVLHLNATNLGYVSNLNQAFEFYSKKVMGFDYFWFAQHDDFYSNDYLSSALNILEENTKFIGVQFQQTTWECPENFHVLKLEDYLENPKNLFHYNGKSKKNVQKHSVVGIIQGVVRARHFPEMYGVQSNLVGTFFSFELLLVMNFLLIGDFALFHGNKYIVSTGETIETLYPDDSYNLNRKSFKKTIKSHFKIFVDWCLQRSYKFGKNRVLMTIIFLNIIHGERRFESLKKFLRFITGNSYNNIEREVRKLHKDNSIFLRSFENIRMSLGKSLLIHRVRYFLYRKLDSNLLRTLLKMKYSAPKSFNGKLRYKLFSDNRVILRTFTDKIDCKEFIANLLNWPRTFFYSSDSSDLVIKNLPRECVVKASHLSGGSLVISCEAPRGASISTSIYGRTFIHPDDLSDLELQKFSKRILSTKYYSGAFTDNGYVGLQKRFIVEELVAGKNPGERVFDIKIFLLNGVPRLIRRMNHADNGQEDKYINDFLPDGTRLNSLFYEPGKIYESGPTEDRNLPDYFPELLKIAEIFGSFTDFIRVDFLCTRDRFVLGELTNFPTGTRGGWNPNKVAQYLNHFYKPWNNYLD